MKIERIALGTAQLGLDYGITNRTGQVSRAGARSILAVCAESGIDTLDTASGYGESESAIGQCAPPEAQFRIVTKTPWFAGLDAPAASQLLHNTFRTSLRNLQKESVYGLLLHHSADLGGPAGAEIWAAMQQLKSEGLVSKIGVSAYDAEDIDRVLETGSVDLIQLPLSPIDRRLMESGHIQALASAGVEIHARSLFLQGLLLADVGTIPEHLAPIASAIVELDLSCAEAGLSRLEAILTFASHEVDVSRFVIGVTSAGELQGIICAAERAEQAEDFQVPEISRVDPRLLNPARWPELA